MGRCGVTGEHHPPLFLQYDVELIEEVEVERHGVRYSAEVYRELRNCKFTARAENGI